jgi:hypothetical protein
MDFTTTPISGETIFYNVDKYSNVLIFQSVNIIPYCKK